MLSDLIKQSENENKFIFFIKTDDIDIQFQRRHLIFNMQHAT